MRPGMFVAIHPAYVTAGVVYGRFVCRNAPSGQVGASCPISHFESVCVYRCFFTSRNYTGWRPMRVYSLVAAVLMCTDPFLAVLSLSVSCLF